MVAKPRKEREGMQQLKTKEAEMLDQLYKNVKMGSDSIVKLMNKVSDGQFKTDLTDQLNGYEGFAAKAKARLKEMGDEAKEENPMTKLWANIGMTMSTLTDSTDSHLAQMVAEGSTMGITDGIKLLRDYENTDVSESSLKLVRDVIEFEERNLERAKKYI
jgi:sugar (pentulose or hexulose) kinase